MRKWVERYCAAGPDGLLSKSRRPHGSPASKVSEQERAWIAELRKRGLESRRIQSELKRSHDLELSRPTIEKVFQNLEPRPRLVRTFTRKGAKRYAKEIPGERVQMDTCKIAPRLYQYTAIDDCTRIPMLALYKHRSGSQPGGRYGGECGFKSRPGHHPKLIERGCPGVHSCPENTSTADHQAAAGRKFAAIATGGS